MQEKLEKDLCCKNDITVDHLVMMLCGQLPDLLSSYNRFHV